MPKRVSQDLVRQTRSDIVSLVAHAEEIAIEQQREISAEALLSMHKIQGRELERLQSLALRNPNIRTEEIDYLESSTRLLEGALQTAQCKLEALRVLVAV